MSKSTKITIISILVTIAISYELVRALVVLKIVSNLW